MQRPSPNHESTDTATDGNAAGASTSSSESLPPDGGEPVEPLPAIEPLPPPPPVPPNALRPWYFREWFLVPTFVWWPSSAILFIRSPWHNGVVVGALSWAWIIIGGGFIFLRFQNNLRDTGNIFLGLVNEQPQPDLTMLMLAAPGLLLTILTQWLWLTRHRPRIRRIREAGGFADYADPSDDNWLAPPTTPLPPSPRRRANRGNARIRRRRR